MYFLTDGSEEAEKSYGFVYSGMACILKSMMERLRFQKDTGIAGITFVLGLRLRPSRRGGGNG